MVEVVEVLSAGRERWEAGLDWQTRAELVPLLAKVKSERAVLIVSHDVKELAPVVDMAWRMLPGGQLQPVPVDQLMMYSM